MLDQHGLITGARFTLSLPSAEQHHER
jgi:hypothetical protein